MARTFRDNVGNEWRIAITVPVLQRIREAAGVDLVEIIEGKHVERLHTDPVFLVSVLYAACGAEIQARSMTPEQFASAIVGDVIDDAVAALGGALVDFFPKYRRDLLQRVLANVRQAMDATSTALLERMTTDRVAEAVREAIDRALGTPGGSSGVAAPSSESSLGH